MKTPEYTQSELPAIQQLEGLGYQYLNATETDERPNTASVILENRLRQAIERLNPWMSASLQEKAFQKITDIQGNSLMERNKTAWELLRGGSYNLADTKGDFHDVKYMDYQNMDNNDFLVVNQMRFANSSSGTSIPDLVIYVNGLPLVVIECKSPKIENPWDEAFKDLVFYQKYSEKLFLYNQFCIGIWKYGGRYGAIQAPQKFYSVFRIKEKTSLNEQGILIDNLLTKERLLDIMRHFIIFENEEGRTVKKLPRYQQLRATNKAIEKLQGGNGGVVWHTQGSGKSITMAYLARKLQAEEFDFKNPTVLILTDRKDLDTQITTTFINIGFKNIYHADSVAGLEALLTNDYGSIITSTIQKFQENESEEEGEAENEKSSVEIENGATTATNVKRDIRVKKEIKEGRLYKTTEVKKDKKWVFEKEEEFDITELSQKENLYVLVDEAHRSQYGFLAAFMRSVMPKAKFVAFTGTPISKEDKSTLGEFYGGDYIDKYTIKESVADGATVELLYDEGIAMMEVEKEKLNKDFDEKFGHETEDKRNKLKQAALKKYQISNKRLTEISKHIINHFRDKIRPDGHKAMLVCQGRPMVIRYKEIFEQLKAEGFHNFDSKAIMSIGSPKKDKIAAKLYANVKWNKDNPTKPQRLITVVLPENVKAASEDFKLPFGDENDTAKSGKKQFDNTAFLIVSDMLLTGYDAPIASCLYLDKPLREHNLLQAIARVNRSRSGKKAGFIVDYSGISGNLIEALTIFSGDLERKDILKNLNEEIPKLEANHTKLLDFFKPIRMDRNYQLPQYVEAAILYIEPLDKRDKFKDLLKQFNESINIVLPNAAALKLKSDFLLFNEIKAEARNAYPDDENLNISADESQMLQDMIDEHLKAKGVRNLLSEPISIIDKDKFEETIQNASPDSKELKMRNNLKHTIKVGLEKNPDFYRPLAERLERLIQDKEAGRLQQLDLLKAFGEVQDKIINEQKAAENKGFTTARQRVIYDSMKALLDDETKAETTTKAIFKAVEAELYMVGWITNGRVLDKIGKKIRRILKKEIPADKVKAKAKDVLDLIKKNSTM
jgi:type I restriction enzyme R subunit